MTPVNPNKGKRCPDDELGRRLRIWRESSNDRDAAAKAGISPPAWVQWRNRWGLPPKNKYNGGGRPRRVDTAKQGTCAQ